MRWYLTVDFPVRLVMSNRLASSRSTARSWGEQRRRGESKITSPLHRIFLKLYLLHEGGMVLSHIHFQPNFLSTNPLMRARRAHALSARPCTLRARATPQNRSRCGSGSIGRPLLVVPLCMRRAHGMGGTPWPWQLPKLPSRAAPNSYRRSRMRPPHARVLNPLACPAYVPWYCYFFLTVVRSVTLICENM